MIITIEYTSHIRISFQFFFSLEISFTIII